MRRRKFISLLGGAVAASSFAARAQQVLPAVGFMSARSPEDSAEALAQFHKGLGEGGFVEGRNVSIKYRWARGDYGRLPGYVDAWTIWQAGQKKAPTHGGAGARSEANGVIPFDLQADRFL